MNTIFAKLFVPAAIAGSLLAPFAANASPAYRHSINGRLAEQRARIRQGVRSDELTRREQYRLIRRDARIRGQEARDRYIHGGKLTVAEHRRLEREENRASAAIYRDKHNGSHRR